MNVHDAMREALNVAIDTLQHLEITSTDSMARADATAALTDIRDILARAALDALDALDAKNQKAQ